MRGRTAPKPRRRSIRFAIVAVVCLLLGAVTTVGVAVGCVLWTDLDVLSYRYIVPPPPWPPCGATIAEPAVFQIDYRGAGFDYERLEGRDRGFDAAGSALGGSPSVGSFTSGLPLRAFTGWYRNLPNGPIATRDSRQGLFDLWSLPLRFGSDRRFIPTTPLFPGFAIDTALYAAAWYLLIFTPLPLIRAGRRRFRVSRGMCGSCGYDLKGSEGGPCPECGAGAGAKA